MLVECNVTIRIRGPRPSTPRGTHRTMIGAEPETMRRHSYTDTQTNFKKSPVIIANSGMALVLSWDTRIQVKRFLFSRPSLRTLRTMARRARDRRWGRIICLTSPSTIVLIQLVHNRKYQTDERGSTYESAATHWFIASVRFLLASPTAAFSGKFLPPRQQDGTDTVEPDLLTKAACPTLIEVRTQPSCRDNLNWLSEAPVNDDAGITNAASISSWVDIVILMSQQKACPTQQNGR